MNIFLIRIKKTIGGISVPPACKRFLLSAFILLLFLLQSTQAQVSIVLDKVPPTTTANDSIYLTGSFNNWDPGDKNYLLRKKDDFYYISLPVGVNSFQFKFTRGNWSMEESTMAGKPISNRIYTRQDAVSDTLRIDIQGWEDRPVLGMVTFHLLKIPGNTPHDAAIYVAGNFNAWAAADPQYRLTLQADSTYKVTIPTDVDTLHFKFTRGTWSSVECRANGRPALNHTYIRKDPSQAVVQAEVEDWTDLVVGSTSFYALILLMAAVQGFFLIVALNAMQHKNKKASMVLSLLILVVSVSLIGRLASYQTSFYNLQPKLLLLSDIIYFLFGPLFYLYMLHLLTVQVKSAAKRWMHFLPALLHVMVYLPLVFQEEMVFTNNVRDQQYELLFAGTGFAALLFNLFYWFKCQRLIHKYQVNVTHTHSYEENLTYLIAFVRLMAVCLLLWAFSYLAYPLASLLNADPLWISELSTDVLWVVLSILTYFLGFYAMSQPEIFSQIRHDEEDEMEADPEHMKIASLPDENLLKMKEELSMLMEKEKPYRNPKLSLQELAEMMDTNIHTISRLINEGYDKNFYDFINEYRIEEFKALMAREQYKNQTFLALALEVGFSSKTTFYRAFKKSTGETPRKYFALAGDRDFEDAE